MTFIVIIYIKDFIEATIYSHNCREQTCLVKRKVFIKLDLAN